MRRLLAALAMLALAASACINMEPVTAIPNPLSITPTRLPNILSPTPLLVYPTFSITPSITPSLPAAIPSQTSTVAPSETATPTPAATETFLPSPTSTHPPSSLEIQWMGCGMGFDVTHGMGEVTNAYVTIVNASGLDLTTVCATLSAADEGRLHPDKTACVPSLPNGAQVTLKLTVDTTYQVTTIVTVAVTSSEGLSAVTDGLACQGLGSFQPPPETMGILQPIP
jgi:hypothetical protein